MKDVLEELATESNFDERAYLSANPDVAQAVKNGSFKSGRSHFDIFGKREGRWLFKNRFSGRKEASAADYWDKNVKVHNGKQRVSWLDSQIIIDSLVRKDSKGKHVNVSQWLKWIKERYAEKPFRAGLSIGCGDGTLERHALQLEICQKMDGFDLSKRSVEISRDTAKKEGLEDKITYSVADMNEHFLPENKYDIAFCGMSLHHILNLEHAMKQIHRSLKKEGVLVINEFIGARQFQFARKQVEVINRILRMLPERLRVDLWNGNVRTEFKVTPLSFMNEHDPSEAIRSDQIIEAVKRIFVIEEEIYYGGSLLHMLLHGIICNFDESKEEDASILKLLACIDELATAGGELPSDFCLLSARKRY